MRRFLGWMDGRKTYLLSGVLVAGVVALVFAGQISPAEAVSWIIAAAFAFGFRSVLEKHHDEILAALFAIAEGGEAYRARDKTALAAAADAAIQDGAALASEIHQEEKQS